MTVSATYLQLRQAIADELGNRTDLLSPLSDSGLTASPIVLAIRSAIAKWEREPFWFLEAYDYGTPLFTTVSGQEFYTSSDASAIATTPDFNGLHALVSATRYPLTLRSWAYLDGLSSNPASRGIPTDWAYFASQVRLYPVPYGAFPIRASRIQRVVDLSADGDSNVWTTHGYDLIRSEAKLMLAIETLHDDDLAARMRVAIYGGSAPAEIGYLAALKGETMRRARSRIRPTQF